LPEEAIKLEGQSEVVPPPSEVISGSCVAATSCKTGRKKKRLTRKAKVILHSIESSKINGHRELRTSTLWNKSEKQMIRNKIFASWGLGNPIHGVVTRIKYTVYLLA
jgi:hypothetical protein